MNEPIRQTTRGMRYMLYFASALVFSVGITLNLLTDHTEEYFAWTINPAITAAFLGAGYWASFVLELMAARERIWARARIAVPAVLVFTTLTLIVTLLHRDRFHFGAPSMMTVAGTWAWVLVYASVPVLMGVLLVGQLRAPGTDPERIARLPVGIRAILSGQGLFLVVIGVGLLIAPLQTAVMWPWELTALTGRAVGAWLLGLGIATIQAVFENDWLRLKPLAASSLLFGFLQVLALIRYAAAVDWSGLASWGYLLFILSLLAVGGYGTWMTRQASRESLERSMEPDASV